MRKVFGLLIVFLSIASAAYAGSFVSGSTGADGAFNPVVNTILNTPANGVFNFKSVYIPAGVTVTFTPNATNTPVYILATNDVTIAGTLSASGGDGSGSNANPGIGGPGGFSGGMGGLQGLNGSTGLGPNGGNGGCRYGTYPNGCGGGGGAISVNSNVIPVIGGSGGGGGGANSAGVAGAGGGGGGGGILIASSGTVTITGSITANGGAGGTAVNRH